MTPPEGRIGSSPEGFNNPENRTGIREIYLRPEMFQNMITVGVTDVATAMTGDIFDPLLYERVDLSLVEKTGTDSASIRILDGHHRIAGIQGHWKIDTAYSPPAKEMAEYILTKKYPELKENQKMQMSDGETHYYLTEEQYYEEAKRPTDQHPELTQKRLAAQFFMDWEGWVGTNVAKNISALAGLQLLGCDEYLMGFRNKEAILGAIEKNEAPLKKYKTPGQKEAIKKGLKSMTKYLFVWNKVYEDVLKNGAYELMTGHDDELPDIIKRREIGGLLSLPSVQQRLDNQSIGDPEGGPKYMQFLEEHLNTAFLSIIQPKIATRRQEVIAIQHMLADTRFTYSDLLDFLKAPSQGELLNQRYKRMNTEKDRISVGTRRPLGGQPGTRNGERDANGKRQTFEEDRRSQSEALGLDVGEMSQRTFENRTIIRSGVDIYTAAKNLLAMPDKLSMDARKALQLVVDMAARYGIVASSSDAAIIKNTQDADNGERSTDAGVTAVQKREQIDENIGVIQNGRKFPYGTADEVVTAVIEGVPISWETMPNSIFGKVVEKVAQELGLPAELLDYSHLAKTSGYSFLKGHNLLGAYQYLKRTAPKFGISRNELLFMKVGIIPSTADEIMELAAKVETDPMLKNQNWKELAASRDDPTFMDAVGSKDQEEMFKKYCNSCLVRGYCLAETLKNGDEAPMGGMTNYSRTLFVNRIGEQIPHGTSGAIVLLRDTNRKRLEGNIQ